MIVLSIDPRLCAVGWGVVEAQGARMLSAWDTAVWKRRRVCRCSTACGHCNWVYADLVNIYHPDDVAFEELFLRGTSRRR